MKLAVHELFRQMDGTAGNWAPLGEPVDVAVIEAMRMADEHERWAADHPDFDVEEEIVGEIMEVVIRELARLP